MPHATVGSTSPSGACSARASPIFVESASPPGSACATLGALFCSARAPRGSTRDPRGAGGPSGPWGSARTCSACASWPGKERSRDLLYLRHLSPPQNMPTARARAERCCLRQRRAVRAPVGDAAATVTMRNALHGRWASRQSLVFPSGLVPQCHRWRRGSRCLCSLRSSCGPLAEGLHHARSPITTVPHRPASSGRRVASALIAGGEIELALLCAAAHGTLPASGKARCARCARRDAGLGAPLGSPAPSRSARPTRRVAPRLSRDKFVGEGPRPRRGRRAAAVSLAPHHGPFGSARTARDPRGLDLVGALPAVWRAGRRGARNQESLPRWEIDT